MRCDISTRATYTALFSLKDVTKICLHACDVGKLLMTLSYAGETRYQSLTNKKTDMKRRKLMSSTNTYPRTSGT